MWKCSRSIKDASRKEYTNLHYLSPLLWAERLWYWKKGGKPLSESHKQALLNSLIGRKISDESRQKMRESHLGHTPVNKGVPHKEETKLKIRESISGRKWINNGEIEKQVVAEEVNNYLKQGFKLGRLHINKIKR